MNEQKEAFPLAWPIGWRRTTSALRTRAKFSNGKDGWSPNGFHGRRSMSVEVATTRVLHELQLMRIARWDITISSNVELRRDGLPYSGRRAPEDPGVCVYWQKGKEHRCIAIDRYDRVEDNLAAVAATLEALRTVERHGGAEILHRAFIGLTALPAPEQPWQTMGFSTSHVTRDQVQTRWRELAGKYHPDRPGGDAEKMSRINAARDALLDSLP